MSRPKNREPKPVNAAKPARVTPIDQLPDLFADPGYRRHTLEQIRAHDIKDWHAYWGSTPMTVRRELIQEAWLGAVSGDAA